VHARRKKPAGTPEGSSGSIPVPNELSTDPALSDAQGVVSSFSGGIIKQMRANMSDPERVTVLKRAWPLVLSFLAAEFDHVTPGERGVGRMSTSPPRLGGRFSKHLANDPIREALALPAERIIVAGFLAGAMQANLVGSPFDLRKRPLQQLWQEWVPGIYAAMRGAGPTSEGLLAGALERPAREFQQAAEQHHLSDGLRKRRALATLREIASFYGQGGVQLHALSTSIADRNFSAGGS
jgi:hypothetical protein